MPAVLETFRVLAALMTLVVAPVVAVAFPDGLRANHDHRGRTNRRSIYNRSLALRGRRVNYWRQAKGGHHEGRVVSIARQLLEGVARRWIPTGEHHSSSGCAREPG